MTLHAPRTRASATVPAAGLLLGQRTAVRWRYGLTPWFAARYREYRCSDQHDHQPEGLLPAGRLAGHPEPAAEPGRAQRPLHQQQRPGQGLRRQKNQWEPRLGFSWDVNGDSSSRSTATPAATTWPCRTTWPSVRPTVRPSCTRTTPTPASIRRPASPTGLTVAGPTYVAGRRDRVRRRIRSRSPPRNLRPQYIDEYILGFDKKLGDNWVYGAKASYRRSEAPRSTTSAIRARSPTR